MIRQWFEAGILGILKSTLPVFTGVKTKWGHLNQVLFIYKTKYHCIGFVSESSTFWPDMSELWLISNQTLHMQYAMAWWIPKDMGSTNACT
jgi:hypothetical protein